MGFTLSSAGDFGVKELKHELMEGDSCSQQRQGNRDWTYLPIRNHQEQNHQQTSHMKQRLSRLWALVTQGASSLRGQQDRGPECPASVLRESAGCWSGEGPRRSPGDSWSQGDRAESPGSPRRSELLGQCPGEEGAPQEPWEWAEGPPGCSVGG